MSKVYPLQDMHVGGPHGGVHLRAGKAYNDNDPFVLANPHLFTEPEEDPRDAEIAELKAQLAAKATPRKATA